MKLPVWTREPLVQFLFGGLLLFVFFAWRGEPVDPASREIDVTRQDQAVLAARFEALMRRPPTDAELDNLIGQYLREEILYREALRLGLDQDDPVVRRRLSQKMNELAGARAETAPASDQILQGWLDAHPERFATDTSYSFDQLWFSDEASAEEANSALASGAAWRELGEEISLPPSIEAQPLASIRSRFGQAFGNGIEGLEPASEWRGPIASGFGWHLVRVTDRQIGVVPTLEQVRTEVENDWRSSTIAERRQEAFEILRDAYRIDIEQ